MSMNRFPRHEQYGWACVGTAILIVLALLALISMTGCGVKKMLPVLTQTKIGEPVTQTEILRTGNRLDAPVGVEPEDVIVIETASGAKGYIAKKAKQHFFEPQQFEFFTNEQAKAEGMTATQPKPSYRWLWVVGISALLVGGGILLWGRIKAPFMVLLGFFRRWKQ